MMFLDMDLDRRAREVRVALVQDRQGDVGHALDQTLETERPLRQRFVTSHRRVAKHGTERKLRFVRLEQRAVGIEEEHVDGAGELPVVDLDLTGDNALPDGDDVLAAHPQDQAVGLGMMFLDMDLDRRAREVRVALVQDRQGDVGHALDQTLETERPLRQRFVTSHRRVAKHGTERKLRFVRLEQRAVGIEEEHVDGAGELPVVDLDLTGDNALPDGDDVLATHPQDQAVSLGMLRTHLGGQHQEQKKRQNRRRTDVF